MKRRDFIIKTSKAMALAAISGGAGVFFHNRQSYAYQPLVAKSGDFRVPVDAALPKVVLAKNKDHIAALRMALDNIGGIKRFVKPGERVTIKPNVGWDRTPEQGADTNPLLVGEMVRLCFEAGAAKVIVTDVTCNFAPRCFMRSGIQAAAEKAGATVVIPQDDDYVQVDLGGKILTTWPVVKHIVDTDRLINMPIVKNHSLSRCTISMKNLYGILGGRRNQLHQQIDQSIVDLVAFCPPTLTVVDATRVMVQGGPTGGSLDYVNIEDSVMCASDPVAADARGVEFLGLKADQVGHIVLAHEHGLGEMDYHKAGYKELI